jgi:hypothetical protein
MSGCSVLTLVKARHRTCPVPRSGYRDCCWTCAAPNIEHVRVSDTPNEQIPSRGYKRPPTLPQLGWLLSSFENTLNQPFLSSKSLSLKLHSNLSFLRDIWAIFLSDPLNLQASTSSTISVCSFLLGAFPLDILGVVWESPSLWWASASLYCHLFHGDLIVENWTRSYWLFNEVWGRGRPGFLWAPQRRRRLPLWLSELQEQILSLCMLISIYSLFFLKFVLA